MSLGFLFAAFLSLASLSTASFACDFQPVFSPVKFDDGVVLVAEWVSASTIWHDPAPQNDLIENFQKFVSALTNVDPIELLKRQNQLYHEHNFNTEAKRMDAVIAGELGHIDDLGCVEGTLFARHLSVRKQPTEFASYIFEKKDEKGMRLKIYHVDSEEISVRFPEKFEAELSANIKNGWTFLIDLHSHPFFFDNQSGDIGGTTVPSSPDVVNYKNMLRLYGLQNAWVTNGFSTIKIKSEEFDRL